MQQPINSNLKSVFAQNMVRLRLHRKIKQNQLSKQLGRDPRTVRRWEKEADTTWPPSELLPALADILGCTIDELFSREPAHLPQTTQEREILKVVRGAKQNLPMQFIIHQLSTLVLKMNKDERMFWQQMGDYLTRDKNK